MDYKKHVVSPNARKYHTVIHDNVRVVFPVMRFECIEFTTDTNHIAYSVQQRLYQWNCKSHAILPDERSLYGVKQRHKYVGILTDTTYYVLYVHVQAKKKLHFSNVNFKNYRYTKLKQRLRHKGQVSLPANLLRLFLMRLCRKILINISNDNAELSHATLRSYTWQDLKRCLIYKMTVDMTVQFFFPI